MYISDGFILADRISRSNIACIRSFSQVHWSGVSVLDPLVKITGLLFQYTRSTSQVHWSGVPVPDPLVRLTGLVFLY